MNRIYLYGLAGARERYSVVRYTYLDGDDFDSIVKRLRYQASWLKIEYPTIEHVYAIDSNKALAWHYREAIRKNSIESFMCFKDILEREGIMVI